MIFKESEDIRMFRDEKFWIGCSSKNDKICLLPEMAGRHGIITGSAGTGKTMTVKVMAESFSDAGIPVFVADVKGDLAGFSKPGQQDLSLSAKLERMELEEYKDSYPMAAFPVNYWDVYGRSGIPMRAMVSDMGPFLLAQMMKLTPLQSEVLSTVFRIADDHQLLLIDTKDLKSMLLYVGENAKELESEYGGFNRQVLNAIVRSVTQLEERGGLQMFGEPNIDPSDLIRTDGNGKGMINLFSAERLIMNPAMYATFMLWLLSALFEELPEVGDTGCPKMVFFFDEAHFLFDAMSKEVVDKLSQLIRMIRSRGVGIYFITQNPSDIPGVIQAELGNRILHALRAYTPAEQKNMKAVAASLRQKPGFQAEKVLAELGIGEAVISFADEEGRPDYAARCEILPPQSYRGMISMAEKQDIILRSDLYEKYRDVYDRYSAYEELSDQKMEMQRKQEEMILEEKKAAELALREKELLKEKERQERELQKEMEKKERDRQRMIDRTVGRIAGSAMSSFGREIGRSVYRGTLGSLKKLF